jgi:hypothetical protein
MSQPLPYPLFQRDGGFPPAALRDTDPGYITKLDEALSRLRRLPLGDCRPSPPVMRMERLDSGEHYLEACVTFLVDVEDGWCHLLPKFLYLVRTWRPENTLVRPTTWQLSVQFHEEDRSFRGATLDFLPLWVNGEMGLYGRRTDFDALEEQCGTEGAWLVERLIERLRELHLSSLLEQHAFPIY